MKPVHLSKIAFSLVVLLGGFLAGSKIGHQKENTNVPSVESALRTESTASLNPGSGSVLSNLSLDRIQTRARSIASNPGSEQDQSDLELLFYEWIQREPLGALSFAKENQRPDWLMEGLKLAGRNSPQDALDWLNENVRETAQKLFFENEIYRGFAQTNPVSAMSAIEEFADSPQRNQLLATVLGEWMYQDPDQVFDWFEEQEFSQFLNGTYQQLMRAYIANDPKDAAILVREMEYNDKKLSYANQVGTQLAKENPQKALEWASELEGETKQSALAGIVDEWGYSGDKSAALSFVENLPEGPDKDRLVSTAIATISHGDPQFLQQILPTLSGAQQQVAASRLGEKFAKYDPKEAIAWIDTLPEGSIKDAGIASALKVTGIQNTAQTLQLAESIADDSLREAILQQGLSSWMEQDPQSALSALNRIETLDPDQRSRISEHLKSLPLDPPSSISTTSNFVFPK